MGAKKIIAGCLVAGCLLAGILIVGVFAVYRMTSNSVSSSPSPENNSKVTTEPVQPPAVTFQTLSETKSPVGCVARFILMDSSHNNRSDVETVAHHIKDMDANEICSFTTIYDDMKAYNTRDEALDPEKAFADERKKTKARKALEKNHDDHLIATITINHQNNLYELQYYPSGTGNSADHTGDETISLN